MPPRTTRAGCKLAPVRALLPFVFAGLIAVAACQAGPLTGSPPSSAIPGNLDVAVVQEGLSVPWDIGFAADGTMFVTERSGTLRIYASGEPNAQQLSSFAVPHVRQTGESGLMGVAVDPDFAANRFVYVCASRDADGESGDAPWVNELLRLRVGDDWSVEVDESLLPKPPRANRQHNGCAVQIDDAGHIWMTMGDSLAGQQGWAQDPARLNGKVLRLNLDGSIPADNPVFEGMSEPSPVYTIGHRNPQGLAFQPGTGRIYEDEHGTSINDEINLIEAGGNYGWGCVTGDGEVGVPNIDQSHCTRSSDFRPPVWASGHPSLATSGAVFLADPIWGEWQNNLIVACLKETDLRRFVISDDGQTATMEEILLDGVFGRLRAAELAPDGSLYISTSNQPNAGGAGSPPQPDLQRDVVVRIRPKT
jgi:glucose/arabinose dehydrogenase